MTVREAAAWASVKPVTMQRWIRAGRIKAYKLTDRSGWQVKLPDLADFFKKHLECSVEEPAA